MEFMNDQEKYQKLGELLGLTCYLHTGSDYFKSDGPTNFSRRCRLWRAC